MGTRSTSLAPPTTIALLTLQEVTGVRPAHRPPQAAAKLWGLEGEKGRKGRKGRRVEVERGRGEKEGEKWRGGEGKRGQVERGRGGEVERGRGGKGEEGERWRGIDGG